jgi:hypothetical protein
VKIPKDSIEIQTDKTISLFLAFWDDKYGPELNNFFPKESSFPIPLDDIVNQLFKVATSIYGQEKFTRAEGVLLEIENLKNRGYLFFDSYPDKMERYGEKQYMIAVIAPSINYFHTLEIKEIFSELSEKIKQKENWDIKNYWKKLNRIMQTDPIFFD